MISWILLVAIALILMTYDDLVKLKNAEAAK